MWHPYLRNTLESIWGQILQKYCPSRMNILEWTSLYRRQFLAGSAEGYRRNKYPRKKFPFSIFIGIDDRWSWADRNRTFFRFLHKVRTCLTCLDPGFLRRAAVFWHDIDLLWSPGVQYFLWAIAWAIVITTAVVECKHARHRRKLDPSNGFPMFAAESVHSDSRSLPAPRTKFEIRLS